MATTKKTAAKKSPITKSTQTENNRKVSSQQSPAQIVAKTKSPSSTQTKSAAKLAPNKVVKPSAKPTQVSPAERMKMIAEAAYYLAEKRGFSPGNDVNDWVAAEQLVDAKLKIKK